MSGIVKGVKKAFKKVGKVAKKVAPIALAAGAAYFTGGAALGLAGTAGGWGAAASSAVSSLGATGTLGSVLTGAATQAGYGALAGAGISAVTGGNVSKGMRTGAMTGAVTGGVSGGMAPRMPTGGDPTAAGRAGERTVTGMGGENLGTIPAPRPTEGASGGLLSNAPGASGGGGSGFLGKGGWLERNQTLAGHVVSGVGQGLMTGAEADAERDLLRERHKLTRQNYEGADPGARYRSAAPGESGVAPAERFDTRFGFEYRYNDKTGRIERVPIA